MTSIRLRYCAALRKVGRDYDGAESEVKPVIMLVAKLKHAVKQVRTKAGAA